MWGWGSWGEVYVCVGNQRNYYANSEKSEKLLHANIEGQQSTAQ